VAAPSARHRAIETEEALTAGFWFFIKKDTKYLRKINKRLSFAQVAAFCVAAMTRPITPNSTH
jgi:hypothetical protein